MNETHRNDPRLDGKTAGRCRPCGTIWLWRRTAKRSLHRARCPRCYRRLSQTTARNVKRATARLVEADPLFVEYVKSEAGELHVEPKAVGVWRVFLERELIGTIQRWDDRDWAWKPTLGRPDVGPGREVSMVAAARKVAHYHAQELAP